MKQQKEKPSDIGLCSDFADFFSSLCTVMTATTEFYNLITSLREKAVSSALIFCKNFQST